MARLSDIKITLDFEPIVKLLCLAIDCKYNGYGLAERPFCNLKHISIGKNGNCEDYTPRNKKDKVDGDV